MLLEVHDVTKHYGPQKALDGVSVSVPKGQVVGLLGPIGPQQPDGCWGVACFPRGWTGNAQFPCP